MADFCVRKVEAWVLYVNPKNMDVDMDMADNTFFDQLTFNSLCFQNFCMRKNEAWVFYLQTFEGILHKLKKSWHERFLNNSADFSFFSVFWKRRPALRTHDTIQILQMRNFDTKLVINFKSTSRVPALRYRTWKRLSCWDTVLFFFWSFFVYFVSN